MPVCTYSLAPPSEHFVLGGGTGECRVTTQPGCAWTATKGGDQGANWITLTGSTSGAGSGGIPYSVAALTILSREGFISIVQAPSAQCGISQALVRPDEARKAEAGPRWQGELLVEGGRGQIVIDGGSVQYQEQGIGQGVLPSSPGSRQVVAQLVTAKGRPGTWTFRLSGSARSGSVRPLAGSPAQVTADSITFRLAGKPGERVVFAFDPLP
jgi:hypothetical protein